MHPILTNGTLEVRKRVFLTGIYLSCLVLLTNCATGPGVAVEDRSVGVEKTIEQDTVGGQRQTAENTAYDDRRIIVERAEHYRQLAESRNERDAINAAISAAEFYIQANDTVNALQSVQALNTAEFDEVQLYRYEVVMAYGEHARGEYRVALSRLAKQLNRPYAQGQITRQHRVDALLLSSFCYQAIGEFDNAVAVLIEREALLYGAARAETTRYIWQVINTLSQDQRHLVIDTTNDATVRNRFEQSLYGQVGSTTTAPTQFDQWRNPSDSKFSSILEHEWKVNSPRVIAVLLPISSRFGKAAQAVQDGLEYQHSQNNSGFKPRLDYYDIGGNPAEITRFYMGAIQNGADMVIGPLGKDYANQLSAYSPNTSTVPTILLGGDQPLGYASSRLSLSPEQEGRLVAERAMAAGHVNAAMLVPNNNRNHTRIADAFSDYWLSHGGKLGISVTYSPKQFDHSVELKQLFEIQQSEARLKRLSNTLGYRPKFTAHRNEDIDFVFMIADNPTGRILRPQINFFGGNSLPVYAPSSVFNGIQDKTNNIDLDNTEFPVMPWVLVSSEVAPYAGQLNRLFAMATDAYRLAANLGRMQADSSLALQGNTGLLNIENNGEIHYQPLWAEFKDGNAESESPLSINTIAPVRSLNNFQRNQQNQNSYDESNWDTRQSSRKTGS